MLIIEHQDSSQTSRRQEVTHCPTHRQAEFLSVSFECIYFCQSHIQVFWYDFQIGNFSACILSCSYSKRWVLMTAHYSHALVLPFLGPL